MRNVYLNRSSEPRFTAALAVTAFYLDYYKKPIEVISVDGDDSIPWDEIDEDVRIYLVGYTPGLDTFKRLVEQAGDIIWIDNDAEAVSRIEAASDDEHKFRRLKALRASDRALCELAWQSYFGWVKNPPLIIGLLGRYEMQASDEENWDEEIVPFNAGFDISQHDPLDPDVFEEFWKVIMCLRRDEEEEREVIDGIIAQGRAK